VNRRADVDDVVTSDRITYRVTRPTMYAQAGQTVSVRCLTTGTPTPTITWDRDGTDLTGMSGITIGSDGTLEISNFGSDDVGVYRCTARRGSQSDSQQTEIFLLRKYGLARSSGHSIRKMLLVSLEPPAISDPPRRVPEKPVSDQDRTYVVGQQSDVIAGRKVTITVPVLGEPAPSVTWTLPSGRRLRPGGRYDRFVVRADGTLEIINSQPSDTGSYQITVSNPAGQRSAVTPVSVFGEMIGVFVYSTVPGCVVMDDVF
jgi:hypothetical protein